MATDTDGHTHTLSHKNIDLAKTSLTANQRLPHGNNFSTKEVGTLVCFKINVLRGKRVLNPYLCTDFFLLP